RDLERAIKLANYQIFEEADRNPVYKDMGTTLCAAFLCKNRIALYNIGDSRAYLSSGDRMKRITSDQTYVNYLFRTGKISAEETESRPDRHVLMNALGIFPSLSMDISILEYHGERVLLCTDGLYNNVSEPEISAILATDERVDQKVVSLIGTANANGGSDNIGIAYWEAIHD
ncbi:MAG: serine/threonine-protein phosphatase, partial [Bacilli bacterium]|nr:serine/threonine-protein phosphatase [Bacilli bacterium]